MRCGVCFFLRKEGCALDLLTECKFKSSVIQIRIMYNVY